MNARALDRVRDYIEAHLGEPLTLDSLARAACLSRFHFARAFRRATGASPMSYITARRLESAKQLLREGRAETICDVAAELGFCDQSHFTRVFRKATGLTPSHYARQARATDTHAYL